MIHNAMIVCALVGAAAPAATDEPSLATMLARAGAYVEEFHRRLSGIVAEEHYVQEARGRELVDPVRLALRSDLLLVRPSGGNEWVQFRDVFEADGRPVRNRSERLSQLFLDPSPSSHVQVGRILDESATFNIGKIERNINTPLFALKVLDRVNQERFKFKRTTDRVPDAFGHGDTPTNAFRTSTEVWVLEYRETESHTLIRTAARKDLPLRGRFWIEPSTGRVLMSELIARSKTVNGTIDVSYQSEPLLGLLVPIEMREHYQDRAGTRITAVATYRSFRQFQVNVDERFLIKK